MTPAQLVRMWRVCIMVAAVVVGALSLAAGQIECAFLAPVWTLIVGAGVERLFFVRPVRPAGADTFRGDR